MAVNTVILVKSGGGYKYPFANDWDIILTNDLEPIFKVKGQLKQTLAYDHLTYSIFKNFNSLAHHQFGH